MLLIYKFNTRLQILFRAAFSELRCFFLGKILIKPTYVITGLPRYSRGYIPEIFITEKVKTDKVSHN